MNRKAREAHKTAYGDIETSAHGSGMPPQFRDWFDRRGRKPRPHQIDLVEKSRARRSTP
jgi:hypothetical protein